MLTFSAIALSACLLGQAAPTATPPASTPAGPAASAPAKPVVETAEVVGAPKPAGAAAAAAVKAGESSPLIVQQSAPAAQQPSSLMNPIFLMVGMVVIMIVVTSWTGRKQKKKQDEMLGALKMNDKVQTTSGIIGTIAEIRDNEVVLRVDESSNTRIRFNRMAIQQVMRPAAGKDNGSTLAVTTTVGQQKATV